MSSPPRSASGSGPSASSSPSSSGLRDGFSLDTTKVSGRAHTTPQRLLRFHLAHDDAGDSYHEIPPNHFLAQQRQHAAAGPSGHSKTPSWAGAGTGTGSGSASSRTPTRIQRSPSCDGTAQELASSPSLERDLAGGLGAMAANLSSSAAAGTAVAPMVVGGQRATSMPDTSTLAAADFDIDVRSGFLPPEEPVRRLDGIEGELWEAALERAMAIPLRKSGGGAAVASADKRAARQWRRSVRDMLVLHPSPQLRDDVRYARRGHVVLSFLAHFYIHSQPDPLPRHDASSTAAKSWQAWLKRPSSTPQSDDANGDNDDGDDDNDAQDERDESAGRYLARVPASLAVPWIALSEQLDIPPVLTYADTVLWNWHLKEPSAGFHADNVAITTTFTGTVSESHFFLTSLLIELRGVEALTLMRRSLDEAFVADGVARRRVAHYLRRLAKVVGVLTDLLSQVRTGCDPRVFYWGIRPWFNGGDSAPANARGDKGWHFEGVDADSNGEDDDDERRLFTGPSAGQSSLIHAIDVFLDVDHTRRKPRVSRRGLVPVADAVGNATTAAAPGQRAQTDDATFMERMQLYMPGHHRRFLTHLRDLSFDEVEDRPRPSASEESQGRRRGKGKGKAREMDMDADGEGDNGMKDEDGDEAMGEAGEDEEMREAAEEEEEEEEEEEPAPSHPIRSLAMADRDHHGRPLAADDRLRASYDTALRALKSLRDEHMRIATLYIVSQARSPPPSEYALLSDLMTQKKPPSEQVGGNQDGGGGGGQKGTGGTDLVSFLKQCRTNTIEALLGEQA
ncbi:IDO-domain-containing protein [Acaromyces ingoldii]|uniref:IDO-domain-containing protein n=1 Tax=Acaromyces ingoldii TaxID=215250 RepID=A0A316YJD1_9BASI|nr:IDO-domain-containing protein [Acaromyces ingoldii]PWN88914.1 IDO-domain-containing protein [Acaromyces ingoldii]